MRITTSILLALVAAGCASYDGYSLKPGVSSEADLRSVMGQPAMEYQEGDGSRRLMYPRGPLGNQTFAAEVGSDGILRAIRPVLKEETFNGIRAGMTRDEILRLIGPPGDTMAFSLSRQVAWDYRYVDVWGYVAIFSVTFDDKGIVVSKFSRRLDQDRGRT
ncbi:MAG: hypothetical protein ACXWAC_01190 [Usitatibacter sp.]